MAALATMHGKEEAIAPALRREVGLEVTVPHGIDTDAFGTFTGEVERRGTPAEAALAKARLAIERTGLPVGLASEGAYGPHPDVAMLASGIELVAVVDRANGIEIVEGARVQETNFAHTRAAAAGEELLDWAQGAGFPEHALVVRPGAGERTDLIFKGIADRKGLAGAIATCAAASADGMALVETDMRADRNPTRMREIAKVATRLGERLATPCPTCSAPGFGAIEVVPGLPCERCGRPTDWAAGTIHGCCRCEERATLPRPDGLEVADPANCGACNP